MQKLITFVCCPKPFNEHFEMIQNNEIQSWLRLPITRNIVMVGKDKGVKECAEKHGMIYEPDVKTNRWNTPLVDSIFALGRKHTPKNQLLCYINSDIILLDSFAESVMAWYKEYGDKVRDVLIVGKRWDWFHPTSIDFTDNDWQTQVIAKAKGDGRMHEHSGIDYFIHTRTTYPFIYPFAIGRYWWDWWLVGNCYRRDVMTVDLSPTAFVIHQNCPWYQQGKIVTNRRKMYQTKEVKRNHSFDKYGRSIKNGTKWISRFIQGRIQFQLK